MTTTPADGTRVLIEAEYICRGDRVRTICPDTAEPRSVAYLDIAQVTTHEPTKITDTAEGVGGSGSSRRAQDEPMMIAVERVKARALGSRDRMVSELAERGFHVDPAPGLVQNVLGIIDDLVRIRTVLAGEVDAAARWANEVAAEHGLCRDVPVTTGDLLGAIWNHLKSTVEERDRLLVQVASEQDAVTRIKTHLVEEQARLRVHLAAVRAELVDEKAAHAKTIDNFEAFAETRAQADECEGAPDTVNATEQPEDAVRRYAGEIWRLASGLADRAIPLAAGSIDTAPVNTALAAIDRLVETVDGLTWRAGVRHNELRLLREERRRFLRQLAELQQLIVTPKLATAPAAFNPLCTCGHSKGRHTWNGAGCEFCMSCAAYTPIPRADLAESNMDGDR